MVSPSWAALTAACSVWKHPGWCATHRSLPAAAGRATAPAPAATIARANAIRVMRFMPTPLVRFGRLPTQIAFGSDTAAAAAARDRRCIAPSSSTDRSIVEPTATEGLSERYRPAQPSRPEAEGRLLRVYQPSTASSRTQRYSDVRRRTTGTSESAPAGHLGLRRTADNLCKWGICANAVLVEPTAERWRIRLTRDRRALVD